ncbi:MAG: hypothetical protein KME04_06295 [Pleurocapsa minor GSE-CHR-MK-17-07R]|jgi:hypothetical protein|nr:hypothetical protein [Pleurocapsa minor GSE-CHR-MK 17-07R]
MPSIISTSTYRVVAVLALMCAALIVVLLLAAPLSARVPALQGASSFSGAINTCDPLFQRAFNTSTLSITGSNVFYETQQFTVSVSGTYSLEMTSTTIPDAHASLYNGPFNPASALTNIQAVDDDSGPGVNPGFLDVSLSQGVTYTLVTTTLTNGMTGTYSWSLSGAGSFTLGDNSITLVCPTATPTITLTPSVTPSPPVNFSGAINTCDPAFQRAFNTSTLSITGSNVFYETQQFTVSVSGTYSLEMTSTTIPDAHASLYNGPFNPASALTNIQAVDDDSGPGVNPGFLDVSLSQGVTYTLVSTTLTNGMTGTYSWTLAGNGGVTLGSNSITPDCNTPTHTLTPSVTPSATITLTPSNTMDPSQTPTASPTPSLTPSETLDPSITPTVTLTPSATIHVSQTPTASPTPSLTPSETLDPSITPSVTLTPSATVDSSITPTPTLTPTVTNTSDLVTEVVPSLTPTAPVQPSQPCRFPLPEGTSQGRVLVTVLAYYDPNPGATTDIIVPGDTTWYVIDTAPGYYRIWIDCLGTPLWIPSFLMSLG